MYMRFMRYQKYEYVYLCYVLLLFTAQNEFVIPSNIGCACLGDTLTYRCTAVGAGSTVWEGTAFECVGNSITLRHTRFNVADGVSGDCNNGDIRLLARSIGVDNDCYTSQLSVFISEQLDRRSILCTHDFGTGLETIGTSTLNVIEGNTIFILIKYHANNMSISRL